MKVELGEKDSDCVASLVVETEPGAAADAYKKAAREIAKQVNIPGFRKGKAPTGMVAEYVGKDYIKSKALSNEFIIDIITAAVKQEKIEFLNIVGLERIDFEDVDSPVNLEAKLELYPDVKLGDYKNLEYKVEIPKQDFDKALEKELENILKQFSSFEEAAEGAEIAMGDELVLDFAGEVNLGTEEEPEWEARDAMKAENYQVMVEKGRFIDNFLEQTVGMKVGDAKDIFVSFPEQYHAEDLAGKPAKFAIKINKISKSTTPELDDELAKKVPNPKADSVEDLKTKLTEALKESYDKNKTVATEEAMLDKLREISDLEIPEAMVDREYSNNMERMRQVYGLAPEQFQQLMGNVDQSGEKDLIRKRLENTFILSAIIAEEKFEITDAELTETWEKYAEEYGYKAKNQDQKDKFKPDLENRINQEKVKELINSNAKVETVEVDPEEETTSDDSEKEAEAV